jgi:hypothetical protein
MFFQKFFPLENFLYNDAIHAWKEGQETIWLYTWMLMFNFCKMFDGRCVLQGFCDYKW